MIDSSHGNLVLITTVFINEMELRFDFQNLQ